MPDPLDALVDAALAGDRAAYDEIVQRHRGLVWSIIRSFGLNRADGEDASQGVWLALVQHLGSLRDRARLASWIATTTRRECLAVARRHARFSHGDVDALDLLPSTEPEAGARLLASERARAVREAMAEIDAHCRQLLALLGAEPPLTYADVSEMMGISIGAIGPTRQRCLEKIRRHRAIRRLSAP